LMTALTAYTNKLLEKIELDTDNDLETIHNELVGLSGSEGLLNALLLYLQEHGQGRFSTDYEAQVLAQIVKFEAIQAMGINLLIEMAKANYGELSDSMIEEYKTTFNDNYIKQMTYYVHEPIITDYVNDTMWYDVNKCPDSGCSNALSAYSLCTNENIGGYTDWDAPYSGELMALAKGLNTRLDYSVVDALIANGFTHSGLTNTNSQWYRPDTGTFEQNGILFISATHSSDWTSRRLMPLHESSGFMEHMIYWHEVNPVEEDNKYGMICKRSTL